MSVWAERDNGHNEFMILQDLGIGSARNGPLGPSRLILVVQCEPGANVSLHTAPAAPPLGQLCEENHACSSVSEPHFPYLCQRTAIRDDMLKTWGIGHEAWPLPMVKISGSQPS